MSGACVVFFPTIDSQADLDDIVARCMWYLAPYSTRIDKIELPVAGGLRLPSALPARFDVEAGSGPAAAAVKAKISLVPESVRGSAVQADPGRDILLMWRHVPEAARGEDLVRLIAAMRAKGRFYDVDPQATRMEGSFYLWAGFNCFTRSADLIEECKKKFAAFAGRLRGAGYERACVFGTGPTLSEYVRGADFSGVACFAANSMVKNNDLLDKLKPVAIVAGDPIFHAGCSRYAGEFRRKLVEALDRTSAYFLTPLRDYPTYLSYLPQRFHDRVIGVPFDAKRPYNADLGKNFYVQPKANILTLLLLPVAASLFKRVDVVGADGRPLSEDAYFWSHDKSAQFNDEMANIREVHPGFFNIDYNDYYETHCDTVREAVEAIEANGGAVHAATPSYVPALRQRFSDPLASPTGVGEVISIDPDALDHLGHFLSYDARIGEALSAGSDSGKRAYSVWGNVNFNHKGTGFAYPFDLVFSQHSWTIGNRPSGPTPESVETFTRELSRALDLRGQRGISRATMLYMYCGSLPHAEAVLAAIGPFQNVQAHINLFWTSFVDYQNADYVKRWRPVIERLLSSGRMTLTVPTERLRDGIKRAFGLDLPLAPHPSTTFSDSEAAALVASSGFEKHVPRTVLFPAGMREEKGFIVGVDAANKLLDQPDFNLSIVVRARQALNTPPRVRKSLDGLSRRVQVSDGELDDAQFSRFLGEGDIVVLPYRAPDFSERTSGLLVDAILLGRPVVVIEGTWLSDVVGAFGNGVAVRYEASAIADGVRAVAKNYALYAANVTRARQAYMQKNTWKRLVENILQQPVVGGRPASATSQAANVAALVIPEVPRSAHAHVDETGVVAHMLTHLKGRQHVMIDVGAHFGGSALHFTRLDWTIHCFEPDPSNRAKLLARFGDAPNVTIDTRAVSDKPATGVSFFTSEESTGISGLHAFRDTHSQTGLVDVTTVTHIIADKGLKKVDFLKIDVEGFDFSVLKGVPWDRIKPDVVECEFEDAKTIPLGHTYKEVADFLVSKGYAVYLSEWHPIIRYGIRHDWRRVLPYPGIELPSDAWGNIVAFLDDPGLAAVQAGFDALVKKSPDGAKPAAKPAVAPGAAKPATPPVAQTASKPPAAQPASAKAKPVAPAAAAVSGAKPVAATPAGQKAPNGNGASAPAQSAAKPSAPPAAAAASPAALAAAALASAAARNGSGSSAAPARAASPASEVAALVSARPVGAQSPATPQPRTSAQAAPASVSAKPPVASQPVVARKLDRNVDVARRKLERSIGPAADLFADAPETAEHATEPKAAASHPAVSTPLAAKQEAIAAAAPPMREVAPVVVDPLPDALHSGVPTALLASVLVLGALAALWWMSQGGEGELFGLPVSGLGLWGPALVGLLAGLAIYLLTRRIDTLQTVGEARVRHLLSSMQASAAKAEQAATGLTSDVSGRLGEVRNSAQALIDVERGKRQLAERRFDEALEQMRTATAEKLAEARQLMSAQFATELQRRTSEMEAALTDRIRKLDAERAEQQRANSAAAERMAAALVSLEARSSAAAARVDGMDGRLGAARRELDKADADVLGKLAALERTVAAISGDHLAGVRKSVRDIEQRLDQHHQNLSLGESKVIAELQGEQEALRQAISMQAAAAIQAEKRLSQKLTSEVSNAAARFADAERRHATLRGEVQAGREALATQASAVADIEKRLSSALAGEIKAVLQKVADADKRHGELRTRLDDALAQVEQRGGDLKAVEQRLSSALAGEVKSLLQKVSDADKRHAERHSALDGKMATAHGLLDKRWTDAAADGNRTQAAMQARLKAVEDKATASKVEIGALEQRLTQAIAAKTKESADSLAKTLAKTDASVGELEQQITSVRAELTRRDQASAAVEKRLTDVGEKQRGELAARVQTMQAELTKHATELTSIETRIAKSLDFAVEQSAARLASSEKRIEELRAALSEVRADLTKRAGEAEAIEKRLKQAVTTQVADTVAKVAAADKRHAELQERLASLTAAVEKRATELPQIEQRIAGVLSAKGQLRDEVQSLLGRVNSHEDVGKDLGGKLDGIGEMIDALGRRDTELAAADNRTSASLKELAAKVEQFAQSLDPLKKQVELLKLEGQKSAETTSQALAQLRDPAALDKVLNPVPYQPFNRRLSPEHVKTLETNWLRRLSVPTSRTALGYMAHRIRQIESRLNGRLATSIEDAMLRSLVVKAVKSAEVEILEIGTLFGIGAAMLHAAAQGPNRRAHLTLIDPLHGYYDGSALDATTQLPIDRATVMANLRLAGIPDADVTLIDRLSTDPDAIAAAEKREYDVLVIDGDHSFAGVGADFAAYAPMVKLGGYIIFDDYNKNDWPDIKRFVDGEMPKHPWCMPVGSEWGTAVFRVAQRIGETQTAAHAPASTTTAGWR